MSDAEQINAVSTQVAVQQGTGVKEVQVIKKADPQIGKIMTAAGKSGKVANAEVPGKKTGGVEFGEGTLRKLTSKEKRVKDDNGVFQKYIEYTAILTDGTVVKYEAQKPLMGKNGAELQPSIKKNKDGSFDFTGLRCAVIKDTPKNDLYNLLGCEFTEVHAARGKDKDVIDVANVELEDGTVIANDGISIAYNANDAVSEIFYPMGSPKEQEYDGEIFGRSSRGSYEEGKNLKKYEQPFSIRKDNIGNGRVKYTEEEFGEGRSIEYVAHDGTKLKESYVNAKEQVLADGYKIKTSPDGKEQWFYTPDGKTISKAEFKNRGLE